MSPTARKPLVLGFIGRGATSTKNMVALLTDLIEADTGKAKIILPATKEHWTEGIEAVADFALEQEFPLVLITDDSTGDVKALKGYLSQAAEKIKVMNPVNKVVKLAAEGSGKLIMLWDDEDDDCYNALELSEAEGIEALDLTSGLHKLEFTGEPEPDDNTVPEDEPEPDTDDEPEPEAEDELDDLDEVELQDIAEGLGLNVEDYPEWDDVREAIREERRIQGEDGGEAEDGGVPTVDEVLDWDFATLKAYAQENGIEVPPRSKTAGYRSAITTFLEAAGSHAEAQEEEAQTLAELQAEGELDLPEDDEELPTPDDGPTAIIDMTPVAEELRELRQELNALTAGLEAINNGLAGDIGKLSRQVTESMIELRTAIMEMSKPGTIQKAQQAAAKEAIGQAEEALEKATGSPGRTVARKAAPAPEKAAAPAKRVNRPTPMPKAPEPAERPLAAFMHLLGKKLTKAQAKDIQIAAALRGRGRPTEDERALIAQAKEVVPNI